MKIRTLVLSYCASAVALPLAIGVVSWVVQNRMFDATEEIARTTSSVRQVMLADMMHDGLRSNVMYALHQASVGNKKNVADETKEIERSAQTFRGAILSLKSSAQTEDILRMSNETLPVLETYIEAARKLGA
ncbi:MAG: hypothetical protein H6934_14615, partial [Burkholderiaceae bacterium]|nr:hypothetical protein [Burkholderiaceae bacterium]